MSPTYVRASLARLGERAGIDKRVHPHDLRRSLACDLAQQGVPVHHIQAQLGHSTLAIMDRYVSHLMPGDVISMIQTHDWGATS
jgi:integrase